MAVEVSQGVCDLCGAPSDSSLQECNWLTCTFQHCEGGLYHQECLEKYLKQSKLEKNRKTGFKCPRGCGKGTKFDQPCPGKIDKSHPIHPRNEDKKKTKLAAVVVEPPRPAKTAAPVAQNGKVAKKDDAKAAAEAGKDSKSTATAKAAPAAKVSSPGATTLSPGTLKAVAKKESAVLPPRPEVVAKQKLAELAAQARRELGLSAPSLSGQSSHGSKGDLQVLGSSLLGASKSGGGAAPSAWGKPVAVAADPPTASPQPPMVSQLPQLQQLYQAASKKPAVKVAAATASAPVAQASKPAPAVPQPVLNPPTPVWPALGSTQSSAAALLAASGSSGSSGLTPRETSVRPVSPPSVWGPSAAQPPASQQPAQQAVATQPSPASRTLSSAGSSGSLSSAAGGSAAAASASAAPAAPAPVPSLATGAGAASGTGLRERTASAAESSEPSTSGRDAVSEEQSASAAVSSPPAAGSQPSSGGTQQPGSEVAEEEVKEQKLTKAQKKNLKRLEKKKAPPPSSAQQQGGSEAPQRAQASTPQREASTATPSASTASSAKARTDADAPSSSRAGAAAAAAAGHKRQQSRGSEDPEQAQAAEADTAATLEDRCVSGIVAQKVLSLVAKLQRLGAPDFVAAAAVQRHGSNLLGALEWLLVAGAAAAAAPPEAVLTAAVESSAAAESEVDISDELQHLRDLQATLGVPAELLFQCVVDCDGDVASATKRLLSASSGSFGPGCYSAAAGASRAGGRPSDGSAEPTAFGQQGAGAGAQLPGSASFYSVSSLDTAASGLEHEHARHHLQPHPPSYSNHFGVRLVDEPAGSSGGYEGGVDSYTAGLLRGGVVLGASGWPNGAYLRDSPPAAANGRSTSRLLHWLRDGRAAAMEEEVGSCNGPAAGCDPALESPFSAHGDGGRRQAASASPSLNNWLGSSGLHVPHQAPLVATTAGRADSQELFSAANSGAFSFSSATGKPEVSGRFSGPAAQRHEASTSAGVGGATEAESAPHTDGESDLSSIMALINMR